MEDPLIHFMRQFVKLQELTLKKEIFAKLQQNQIPDGVNSDSFFKFILPFSSNFKIDKNRWESNWPSVILV